MNKQAKPQRAVAIALRLAAAACLTGMLSACIGGVPTNRSLYSERQPVVSRSEYILDLRTENDTVPPSELRRLSGWFEALDLRYGDTVSVAAEGVGPGALAAISAVAASEGMLLRDAPPGTRGSVAAGPAAGVARVIVTRMTASVPGCPDWSAKSSANPSNATSPGYGCAVNGNLAAMVADPQDLLRGQRENGSTVVMSSTKAIDSYRAQMPTGEQGLKAVASSGEQP